MSYFTDADILVLTPTAPATAVYLNSDDWGSGTRCAAQGGALFTAPIPANFVVPGSHQGSPDGDTPNAAAVILAADGHTLIQTQPFARCAGQGPTSHYMFGSENLLGTGETGSHGGSGLSALGGTVRLGELVPGGTVRHALKLNIDSANFYSGFSGYRWPAWKSDAGGAGYGGSIPEVRMGSLLASRPDFPISTLETEPGRIMAQAFRDYGAYIVDTSGWSIYNFVTERSPDGAVQDEFQRVWGYSLNAGVGANGWARDLDKIFTNLYVVDSWNKATWQIVSASNGVLGAGLGVARVPWAPPIGGIVPPPPPSPDTTPPVSTAALSGTPGAANWFVSSVAVTVSATDAQSGVGTIQVRTDGSAWRLYTSPVTVAGDGTHTVDYYATDVAGNVESTHTVNVRIDSVAPASTSQVAGTPAGSGYLSPITVTLAATDATSGVRSVSYRIDGGAQWTYASPFLIGGNGTHLLEYSAADQAGNPEGVHTLSISLSGATGTHASPVTALSMGGTGGANGWYTSNVDVTLTASSASGSAILVASHLDGGLWSLYTVTFPVRDGRHTLEFQASDAAGYLEAMQSATINVDTTPPTIVKAADVIAPDGTFSWTGSDSLSGIARYEVSLDGGPFVSMGTSTSLTQQWTLGNHVATVRAWDNAGNEGTSSIPFRVDANAVTPGTPGPTWIEIVQTGPPGTLFLVIGFILVSVSLLFLNRQKMDRLARMRLRRRATRSP